MNERSSSTMRCLHDYMSTGMTQEQLLSLDILQIHYNVSLDLDKAVDKEVDIYDWLHPRRLALDSLIKPYNAAIHNIMLC